MCGLSAQATDWYREAVPPEYRRESRPKPATLDVDIADTGERLLHLVGSFPKARLVLGEVAENFCVRRGCPAWISGADFRRECPAWTLPPVCMSAVCRPTDGR